MENKNNSICLECDKEFKNKRALASHQRLIHKKGNKKKDETKTAKNLFPVSNEFEKKEESKASLNWENEVKESIKNWEDTITNEMEDWENNIAKEMKEWRKQSKQGG